MNTERICPSCRKPLPPDVPLGLCPECLIKAGFSTGTGPGSADSGFVPPQVEQIAKLFPQLEIIEFIGKGGMGAVYKTRQPALDRFVALKILSPRVAGEPGFAERFNREARALARLNHPNIVAVHDFGQAGGLHYLIMEFVDGANLREVERAGRLAPEQALAIVPQICEALQFAHNEGVVHRDIKPENLLLDKRGRVKITDFGIAKILGVTAGKVSLTGAKDVVGTPHYMAPEQIERPTKVDHRADIYSLGVVFYEMLTGELPLGKFASPSAKVQVDVRLDEVVLRALEKEPECRYQQASVLKTDVETIAATPLGGEIQTKGRAPRLSRTAVVGAVCLPLSFVPFVWLIALLTAYASKATPGTVTNWGATLITTIFFLALTLALPLATSALGWLAVAQIRRSAGQIYGLKLALFDGLAFPLLVLDAVIGGLWIWAAKLFAIYVLKLHDSLFLSLSDALIWLLLSMATMTWVDFQIISRVWRAVNRPSNGMPSSVVPSGRYAGQQVKGPAIGLLAAVGLQLVVFFALVGYAIPAVAREANSAAGLAVVSGMAALSLVAAVVVLSGAITMLKLRRYSLALVASVIAMVAGPAAILGLPFGIWSLVVLNRREVREAFDENRISLHRSTGARIGWALVILTSLVLMGIAMPNFLPRRTTGTSLINQPPLTVTGRVTDAFTGAPIAHARVDDNSYDAGPTKAPQQAWTDGNGNYELRTWPEEHTLAASAPGYETRLATLLTSLWGTERAARMDFQLRPRNAGASAQTSTSELAAKLRTAAPVMEGIRGAWTEAVEAIRVNDAPNALTALRKLEPRVQEFHRMMTGTSLEAGAADALEKLKPLKSALEKGDLAATQPAMEAMASLGRSMEAQVKAITDASRPPSPEAVAGLVNPVVLQRDDGKQTGVQSIATSGHAVEFDRPGPARYVEAVHIFCSRYGTPEPPQEDFHLYLLNEQQQVLSDAKFPYSMIERGEPRWYTLRTPSVEVPEKFLVALNFNPHQTRGIYLAYTATNGSVCHSLIGLPGDGYEFWKPVEWMVRVSLCAEPTKAKGFQCLADWKPPVRHDPFASCRMVTFGGEKSEGMQSYGGQGPAIHFRLSEHFTGASVGKNASLKGVRLYASRYGAGYPPEETKLRVILRDSKGTTLFETGFAYAQFGYRAGWVDLVFDKAVVISEPEQLLTIAFDPEATQRKGIYFHFQKDPATSHSLVGSVRTGFTELPDREWMMQAAFE